MHSLNLPQATILLKMSESLINALSAIAFIAFLTASAWWLRNRGKQWSSDDGTQCIGQLKLSLTDGNTSWKEVRLHIDTSLQQVACKARGRNASQCNGNWMVLGKPHISHLDERDLLYSSYAVARKSDPEIVAIIRIPQDSKSTSVFNTLLAV